MNKPMKTFMGLMLCGTMLATTGCQSTGGMSKKETGMLVGAIAGGVAGAFFGKGTGQLVAVGLGAALGAALGNYIGAELDEADAAKVEENAVAALENSKDGETVTWANPDTKVDAKLTPVSTRTEMRNMQIARLKTVDAPGELEVIGQPYEVKGSKLFVRTGPSTQKPIATSIQRGDVVTAVGRVAGSDWILVAREGKSFGYVHGDYVEPASDESLANALAEKKAKKEQIAQTVTDKDKAQQQATAIDLDAWEPNIRESNAIDLDEVFVEDEDVVVEKVASKTECREMEANIKTEKDNTVDKFTACKTADGAWELI